MDAAHMRATVEKYIEAVSTDNIELIREIYADNATVEDPVGSDPHEGIAAIEAFYSRIHGVGVKLELTGNARCAANSVAFPFTATTQGRTLEIIDVFEFNADGKVVSMKAYWGA
ncbi:MAG: nuclear transport factor 2 family protein [Pseudomonadales bacterium]|nr:nuclear transport factor 2 family protein [Pseudomonadales bacterium]